MKDLYEQCLYDIEMNYRYGELENDDDIKRMIDIYVSYNMDYIHKCFKEKTFKEAKKKIKKIDKESK